MNENELSDEKLKLVDAAINTLMEHFDTVQIFCTLHETDSGTYNFQKGAGNYFARRGHIQYWMNREAEDDKIDQRDFREE